MRRLASLTVLTVAVALTSLTGLAGPAAAAAPSTASQEARVLTLVNAARARAHCAPLKADARLTSAARAHSADMARRKYFAHVTPGGTTPWTRIAQAGYPKVTLAENIAAGQPTADAVITAWTASPGHRRNILDCSLRSVGTGLAVGGPYRYYWTQDFGSR